LIDFEMIFACDASAVFYLDQQRVEIQPGEVLVIPPGTLHYSKPEDIPPFTYEFIHFETEADWQVLSNDESMEFLADKLKGVPDRSRDYFMLPESRYENICLDTVIKMGSSQPEIMKLFGKAFRERVSPQINSSQLASLCVMEILVLLTRCTLEKIGNVRDFKVPRKTSRLVQEAVFIMHENYETLTEIKDLAKNLSVTPQHLIHLFKENLQTTPLEYLNRLKLDKAKKLLMNSNLSIKEVAFASGFRSPHYFSRIFRLKEGCSPSEFAKNIHRNRLD
jgi:AraC-like DNA-binding protein